MIGTKNELIKNILKLKIKENDANYQSKTSKEYIP